MKEKREKHKYQGSQEFEVTLGEFIERAVIYSYSDWAFRIFW